MSSNPSAVSDPSPVSVATEAFTALGREVRQEPSSKGNPVVLLSATRYVPHVVLAEALNQAILSRCGYVIAPASLLRPEIARLAEEPPRFGAPKREDVEHISVHGGVTFASGVDGEGVPSLMSDGTIAIIGFDCAHTGDAPDMETAERFAMPDADVQRALAVRGRPAGEGHAWTTEEMLSECRRLADQILAEPVDETSDDTANI